MVDFAKLLAEQAAKNFKNRRDTKEVIDTIKRLPIIRKAQAALDTAKSIKAGADSVMKMKRK